MDKIIEITGVELSCVLDTFANYIDAARERARTWPSSLKVTVDGDSFKFKIDGGTWTPGYGQLDPACSAAERKPAPSMGAEVRVLPWPSWGES